VLELITLFSQDHEDTPLLIGNEVIIGYVFSYLRPKKNGIDVPAETSRLAALALCRLAQQFDEAVLS
jgi:hypothetical protein